MGGFSVEWLSVLGLIISNTHLLITPRNTVQHNLEFLIWAYNLLYRSMISVTSVQCTAVVEFWGHGSTKSKFLPRNQFQIFFIWPWSIKFDIPFENKVNQKIFDIEFQLESQILVPFTVWKSNKKAFVKLFL